MKDMVLIKRFDPRIFCLKFTLITGELYDDINVYMLWVTPSKADAHISNCCYTKMYWSLYSIGNINMRVFPGRNYPKQYMLIVFDHVLYYLTVGQINKTITVLLIVCVCVCVCVE